MTQTIVRGIKTMIDEANAVVEVLSAEDAIKAVQQPDVILIDIRDPREIERSGKPLCQAGVPGEQEVHLPLRRGIALRTRGKDGARHGPCAGGAHGRRFCGLARRGRRGGKGRAAEGLTNCCPSGVERQLQVNPEPRHGTMNSSRFPATPIGVAEVSASRLRRLSHPGLTTKGIS